MHHYTGTVSHWKDFGAQQRSAFRPCSDHLRCDRDTDRVAVGAQLRHVARMPCSQREKFGLSRPKVSVWEGNPHRVLPNGRCERRVAQGILGTGDHLTPAIGGRTPATHARPELSNILRGILLMCAGVSTFPFMNAAVKLLTAHYPATQITWARFTGHLMVMLIVFLPRYRWTLLRTRRPVVQMGRSILMLLSNLLFVMAIGRVPLATASAIGFTAPLIVTALSVPLLGESVGWRRWSAVLVGFTGALLVIRPGSGFSDPSVLLLLLSSLAYALYQIATRWVGRYDNAATGIIFTALFGSLAMSLPMLFVFVMPLSVWDALLFGSLGLLGGFGHYLVIRAFQFGAAAVIAPLGYVELVGTTVLGFLIFGNFPDAWTWAGAGLIIASGIYIAWREQRRKVVRT
jgi:drug/metabolite transporter (DMT)-like permease